MHPLKQIRHLLREPSINQGTVIRSTATNTLLATPKGSLSVSRSLNDATAYKPGDVVLLANGIIVGRRHRTPTIYVV